MKKLLLTLLLPLSIISSATYGEELNSLFGITLNDNAENYVSSNYIDSNKSKDNETIEGYFDLNITDKIKTKSPYASSYWVVIDSDNRIHQIRGSDDVVNLEICLEIQKDLFSTFEEKYQVDFDYWEKSLPKFKKYSRYHWTDSNNIISIQCTKVYEETSAKRQIYLRSGLLSQAITDFYDSGL